MIPASEIVIAFNSVNSKKTFTCRASAPKKDGKGEVVHFRSTTGMVALIYHCDDGRFAVQFTKFVGAFGDYMKAISRSLYTVLNSLKAAGLPFDAPHDLGGMVVEATTTADNTVYVSYKSQRPGNPVMPELRGGDPYKTFAEHLKDPIEGARTLSVSPALGAPYGGTLADAMAQMRNSRDDMNALHNAAIAAGARFDGMGEYDFTAPICLNCMTHHAPENGCKKNSTE